MPYCVQCGNRVSDIDRFCAICGTAQAVGATPKPGPPRDVLSGISGRNASVLCYIPMAGWIACVVVLASIRFRHDAEVRFNAFQGLYLFVAYLLVSWVLTPFMMFHFDHDLGFRVAVGGVLKAAVFAVWIFMIVKVSQGQSFHLPILGELAERSVSEQR